MTTWLILIAAAYVLGSIPFGVMIAKAHGVDIRTQGSRNIGATNVGRVLGRKWGVLCFFFDFLKGAVPVAVAGMVSGVLGEPIANMTTADMWAWLAVAAAAIAGHMASVFLRFKGGKGVATSFGTLVAMWPLLTLPAAGALVVWAVTVKLTRYVSLASICAAVSLPVWFAVQVVIAGDMAGATDRLVHAHPPLVVTTLLAALVVWRHRANIGRLVRGEESRVG